MANTRKTLLNGVARVQSLVEAAHKADKDSIQAGKEAGAAALYQFILHGRAEELDALYLGYSPLMQGNMRQYFVQAIIDKFGFGGEFAEGKWIKRNTPFIRFDRRKYEGKGGFLILSSDPKKNPDMSPTQLKHIKKAKDAIIKAGETELQIDWKTAGDEAREVQEWDAKQFRNRMFRLMKDGVKHGKMLGLTNNEIASAGKAFGLSAEQITELLEFLEASDGETVDLTDSYKPLPEEDKAIKDMPILIEAQKPKAAEVQESANA